MARCLRAALIFALLWGGIYLYERSDTFQDTVHTVRQAASDSLAWGIRIYEGLSQPDATSPATSAAPNTRETTSTPTPIATASARVDSQPTPSSTPTPAAPKASNGTADLFDLSGMETRVHQLVNEYRIAEGQNPFDWDHDLAALARAHSSDMAVNDFFRHVNLAGEDPSARARSAGYDCRNPLSIGVAENIYWSTAYSSWFSSGSMITYDWYTQEELAHLFVGGWMDSPGHRRNILDQRYTHTGTGVAFGTAEGLDHAVYITQLFC